MRARLLQLEELVRSWLERRWLDRVGPQLPPRPAPPAPSTCSCRTAVPLATHLQVVAELERLSTQPRPGWAVTKGPIGQHPERDRGRLVLNGELL